MTRLQQIDFSRETCAQIVPDLFPLIEKHHAEVGMFKDSELNPYFEVYEGMEKQDLLRIYTARCQGKLVGYSIFFLNAHVHYRGSKRATQDLLFIDPEHRGFGLRFIDYYEDELRKDGAEVIYSIVTTRLDFRKILERKKYQLSEWIYTKKL